MKTDLYKTYYTEADDYYKDYVSYQGQSWEDFLVNYIGVADESEYEDYLKDEAIKNIKSKYVLEAIAENEGITISDEEIEEQIQGFIDTGNYSSRDDVLSYITEEDIKLNLMYHSVTDIIKNNAVDAVLGDTTED
jgi:trigger factor